MPKLKTHKGMKKRFKVSANGKVQHKRCGSSHLMSHKSGKQVRRLRKKSTLKVSAEARRIRNALLEQAERQSRERRGRRSWRRWPTPTRPRAGEPGRHDGRREVLSRTPWRRGRSCRDRAVGTGGRDSPIVRND